MVGLDFEFFLRREILNFTQKKEMKDRKSDFAGVRADSETTNRNRTGKSRENQYK